MPPTVGENWPGAQAWQVDWPVEFATMPLGHSVQVWLPSVALNWPAAAREQRAQEKSARNLDRGLTWAGHADRGVKEVGAWEGEGAQVGDEMVVKAIREPAQKHTQQELSNGQPEPPTSTTDASTQNCSKH